jgi:hypothetical protein
LNLGESTQLALPAMVPQVSEKTSPCNKSLASIVR